MANQITVYPANDPALDLKTIRDAVNAVKEGGTVILKRHAKDAPANVVTPFNFGGDDESNCITLTKSVHIRGEPVNIADREWHDPQGWAAGVKEGCGTTIVGGRVPFRVTLPVKKAAPAGVTIENIRFAGFYRMAVGIRAAHGTSKVTGCSFVDFKKSLTGKPQGAFPIVADSSDDPSLLSGDLFLTNNYFGKPPQPSMNNALHVSNCELHKLEFKQNRIEDVHFVGFAVYGVPGHTDIIENSITKNGTYANPAVAINLGAAISFGIVVGKSLREDGSFTIRDNTIEVGAPESYGIAVFRLQQPANGKPCVVSGNVVTMGPGADLTGRAALAFMGAGWWKVKCEKNTILGPAGLAGMGSAPFGISVTTGKPAFVGGKVQAPSPSRMEISSNHLEDFAPGRCHVFVGPDVNGLELRDNEFGVASLQPPNAGDPWVLGALPGDTLKAGVWWQGDDGAISENHFSAQFPGWEKAPNVGCIYLDKAAGKNVIEYFADEPPFQFGQGYDKNQIFDANGMNTTNAFIPMHKPVPKKAPVPH